MYFPRGRQDQKIAAYRQLLWGIGLISREFAGNKKPDIIIGLELARQAGNSVNRNGICSVALILPLAFAQGVHFFAQSSPA